MNIKAMIDERVKAQVDHQLEEKIAPLSALLNQIWARVQADGAAGEDIPPIPDPSIPDPSIPQTPIPDSSIPQTPIDIPPIPGFGPGAKVSEGEAQAADEAAVRKRLEQAAATRQQEQSAAIARRTAMIQARIAQKLNAFQR